MNDTHDPIGSWSINEGFDDILRKSCRLMAQRGFHGTSMRDLAQETGRSLSGLYHYFRSKEDLLFLVNANGFATLNDSWRRLGPTLPTPAERLYGFVYFHMSYFAEHMDEMRVMTWGTQTLRLDKARIIQKQKDQYTKAAVEIVREVLNARRADGSDEQKLERQALLLFGMMNWAFTWFNARRYGAFSDLVADIYETFVGGICGVDTDPAELERMEREVKATFKRNKAASMWEVSAGPGSGQG